ncbi:MAG: DUF1641 domain-containing protein, partial [Anaerolineae bacterium]|nr:DUF1641 domain-containing protein [Anaerolineae bacterium]
MDQTQVLLELNQKLDRLTGQMEEMTEFVESQRRRQREWDDLKADLTPVAMDMYQVAVEQLSEVEPYVQLEDLLYLVKRLARNTRNIEQLLDQVESVSDLLQDAGPIVNDAFLTAVQQMDVMERKGYFRLIKEGQYVLDNVVDAFGPQDVRQLGDNVVTILMTIKEMTQPEVMTMAQNLAGTMRKTEAQPEEVNTSFWSILKQLRDPQTRRGLAVTLEMLKAVGADQTSTNGSTTINN